MEKWAPIKGYEGIYEISNYGKVKSLSRERHCGHKGSAPQKRKETLLTVFNHRLGYKMVKLSKDGKYKHLYLHRLLAEHFIVKPRNKHEINHKDGDKTNNSLNNLEWCTRSQNMRHAFKTNLKIARRGEEINKAKLTEVEVKEIRRLYKTGNYTQKELGAIYNVSIANISEIVRNKTWVGV